MDHKPEWRGRINQKDKDGCTVLHVVAAAHYPGYLIKCKWRHQAAGGAVGWMTSGIREPDHTFLPLSSWDGLKRAKPYVDLSMTGRAGYMQERCGSREGRLAGVPMLFGLR